MKTKDLPRSGPGGPVRQVFFKSSRQWRRPNVAEKNRTLINDYTQGNCTRNLVVFAAPIFLSNLMQTIYNVVDMIVVGQALGRVGLSGVAIGGDVSHFLLFLVMGLTSAGQVIISQLIGMNKRERIGKFVGTMFTFLMLCAVVLGGICLILRKQLLGVMNTPAESWDAALSYSTISILGLIFIYGYNITSSVLRGLGDSRHPFLFVVIAACTNIVLDVALVLWLKMGTAGAAIATVFSQALSFTCSVIFLYRARRRLGFVIEKRDFLHLDTEMLVKLLKLGIPMALKMAAVQISKLFVNSFINSYGVAVSAFAGVANKFNTIAALISNSINAAGSTIVGQNIGSEKYDRVRQTLRSMFVITLSIAAVFALALWLFPRQIYGAFTSDEEVLAIGLRYMPIAAVQFLSSALRAPMNSLINGSGNYKVNFVTAIADGIVMRVGLSLLFGLALGMGAFGFWTGDAVASFTPFIMGMAFYLTGRWKKRMDA